MSCLSLSHCLSSRANRVSLLLHLPCLLPSVCPRIFLFSTLSCRLSVFFTHFLTFSPKYLSILCPFVINSFIYFLVFLNFYFFSTNDLFIFSALPFCLALLSFFLLLHPHAYIHFSSTHLFTSRQQCPSFLSRLLSLIAYLFCPPPPHFYYFSSISSYHLFSPA